MLSQQAIEDTQIYTSLMSSALGMLQHSQILDLVQNNIPQADLYDYDTAFRRYSAIPPGLCFLFSFRRIPAAF